jgi:MFS family permease
MSTQLSSYLISILNGTSLFGRLISGVLADKVGALNMLCACGLGTGILNLCWQRIATNTSIIVLSALYGFFSEAITSLMSVALAHVLDSPRDIGTYMGTGMATISFAALAGPPINGTLVTNYGGFDQAQIFSGVVILVGAFAVMLPRQAPGKRTSWQGLISLVEQESGFRIENGVARYIWGLILDLKF